MAGLLAVMAGCGAPCGLQQAHDRWFRATGLEAPDTTRWIFADAKRVDCHDGVLYGAHYGCTSGRNTGRPIEVKVAARCEACDEVTLHEYGHVLGGEHSRSGVMVPSKSDAGYAPQCISSQDVDVVCALRSCPWKRPECGSSGPPSVEAFKGAGKSSSGS